MSSLVRRSACLLSALVVALASLSGPAVSGPAKATWGPPQVVSNLPGQAYKVQVGVAPDGSAVAAWLQMGKKGAQRVYVARRKSDVWSRPRRLSHLKALALAVAAQAGGQVSVVWSRMVQDQPVIEERHWSGRSWSSVVRLGGGSAPSLAIDSSGSTTVAWGGDHGLQVARRPARGRWGAVRVLRPSGRVFETQLSANAAGDVVVGWAQTRSRPSQPSQVRFSLRPAGGRWGPVRTLLPRSESYSPQVAMGPLGRALVVWTTYAFSGHTYHNGIAWARSTAAGGWSRPRHLTFGLLEDGGRPDLSMNRAGEAVAAWDAGDHSGSAIWGARFRRSGRWTAPVRLSRVGWAWSQRAWIDARGTAYVLGDWSDPKAGSWVVAYTQRVGGSWSVRRKVVRAHLADAGGAGDLLVMLYLLRDWDAGGPLRSRVLDVTGG